MSRTMKEYLVDIKTRIQESMDDIIAACDAKGIQGIPDTVKLSQLADYVRSIYQSDFEFYFNFQDIDQFGNPHAIRSGSPSSSMFGLNPGFDDITPQVFDFTEGYLPEGQIQTVKQGIWYHGTDEWLTTEMSDPSLMILESVASENII